MDVAGEEGGAKAEESTIRGRDGAGTREVGEAGCSASGSGGRGLGDNGSADGPAGRGCEICLLSGTNALAGSEGKLVSADGVAPCPA